MIKLILYEEYSREEVHNIFSPDTSFTPQAGTWGLQGVVPIPDRLGDWVFFVTFGQTQGEHTFDEGITEDGVPRVACCAVLCGFQIFLEWEVKAGHLSRLFTQGSSREFQTLPCEASVPDLEPSPSERARRPSPGKELPRPHAHYLSV